MPPIFPMGSTILCQKKKSCLASDKAEKKTMVRKRKPESLCLFIYVLFLWRH